MPTLPPGFVAVLATALVAQSSQQPTFRTGTNLVQVDVIVSGKDGNPVTDLAADDFQLLDDGHAVPITAFKFLNTETADPRDRYPVRTADDEEREAGRDDTRLFAILLDDYHVGRFGPLRIVEPLIAFVRSLPPTDLVGVFYPLDSPRDVHLTYDRASVIAAIRRFHGRSRDYIPIHPVEEEHLRYQRSIERLRTQVVLTGATAIMSRLGALKVGRKTLVWVAEGYTPAGYEGDFLSFNEDLRAVYESANRNNVSIYPIDPRGLMFDAPRGQIETLRLLAYSTAGRATVNRNDLKKALLEVPRESAAYYLLGFASEHPADGKFHHITVRLKRPRLSIKSRIGYWSLTEAELASSRAAPLVVPAAITDAFKRLAEDLRPLNDDEPPPAKAYDDGAPLSLLAMPSIATVDGAKAPQPAERPEFPRRQRIVIRASIVGQPTPDIAAQLLDRLGRKLTTLNTSVSEGTCDVPLSLGSLGPGDYVVQLTARRNGEQVDRFVALRVLK